LSTISVNMTCRDQGSIELELPMAQAVQVSLLYLCQHTHQGTGYLPLLRTVVVFVSLLERETSPSYIQFNFRH